VSYVDAVDNPIGVSVTNASCVSPSVCSASVLTSCPTDLKSGSVCLSPCTRFNTDQFCCRGAFGTPATCVVSNWTATAQTYVNNLHSLCPREYSYAYDENAGGALQTCPTGSDFTITFCPGAGAPPATNLALNRPTTSSSNESASFTPNLAVDGNGGTRWSSAFSDPQWIRVDLGATRTITRVVLRWETAFGRSYQIQTSNDGTTWTTIRSTTTGAGGVEDFTVTGSGRFVRMNGTARGTQWGYSLWEFEVYGP
jgi:hypothetical protein